MIYYADINRKKPGVPISSKTGENTHISIVRRLDFKNVTYNGILIATK